MIPIEIDLKNFLAYASPGALNLEGIDVAVLTGENGAGKSSVLDGITWALWGKARAPVDELIREGESDMAVQLVFESHGERYLVLRKRKQDSRSSLDLQIYDAQEGKNIIWKSLAGSNMRETQDQITNIVGLDYETFINASMILQGRIDEFTSKTAGARKQILSDILMLGRWETYEAAAKVQAKAVEMAVDRLEGQILTAASMVNAHKDIDAEISVAQAVAQQKAALLEARERTHRAQQEILAVIDTAKGRARDLEDRVTEIKKDLKAAVAEVDRYKYLPPASELQEELESVSSQLTDTTESNERMGKISEMIGALEGEINGLVDANKLLQVQIIDAQANVDTLKAIDKPHCPTCHQPLDEEERESVMQDILAAITISNNDIQGNHESAFAKEQDQQKLRKEENELQEHIGNMNTVEKQVARVEVEIAEHDEKLGTKERAEERLTVLEERLASARTDAREATEALTDLEADVTIDRVTDAQLSAMRKEKEDADRMVGAIQQQQENVKQTLLQLDAWRKEQIEKAEEYGVLKEVRVAFSKKGVPAMLIEQAVPEIERAANDLLLRLTDGRMNVRFDTQKELKSGDMAEALDIVISDELGARSYENYSGGEKFKINFAIRIALSKLLAKRAGVQLRSLFIDEGFGTQDASGREQVVAAINAIKDDFDCILVITHIEELKEAFPVQIEVIKSDSGSTFRVIR